MTSYAVGSSGSFFFFLLLFFFLSLSLSLSLLVILFVLHKEDVPKILDTIFIHSGRIMTEKFEEEKGERVLEKGKKKK